MDLALSIVRLSWWRKFCFSLQSGLQNDLQGSLQIILQRYGEGVQFIAKQGK